MKKCIVCPNNLPKNKSKYCCKECYEKQQIIDSVKRARGKFKLSEAKKALKEEILWMWVSVSVSDMMKYKGIN